MSVLVNLTPDRRDAWKAAAEAKGMKLSEWIRHRCDGGLEKEIRDGLTDMAGPGNPAFKKQTKKRKR